MSAIWIAIASISVLGLVFGIILGYASRRFAVEDDPVVEKIDELLPQSQCGQCGYHGCRPYAEAVGVQGEKINRCAPGGEAVMLKIAALLNVDPQPVDGDEQAQSLFVPLLLSTKPTALAAQNVFRRVLLTLLWAQRARCIPLWRICAPAVISAWRPARRSV